MKLFLWCSLGNFHKYLCWYQSRCCNSPSQTSYRFHLSLDIFSKRKFSTILPSKSPIGESLIKSDWYSCAWCETQLQDSPMNYARVWAAQMNVELWGQTTVGNRVFKYLISFFLVFPIVPTICRGGRIYLVWTYGCDGYFDGRHFATSPLRHTGIVLVRWWFRLITQSLMDCLNIDRSIR